MTEGIYVLADDRVITQAAALIQSIRKNSSLPVVVVPYSTDISYITKLVEKFADCKVIDDKQFAPVAAHWHYKLNRLLYAYCERVSTKHKSVATCLRGNYSRFVTFEDFMPFDKFLMLDADIVIRDKTFLSRVMEVLEDCHIVSLDHFHKMGRLHYFGQKKNQASGHRDSYMFCVGAYAARKLPNASYALEKALREAYDYDSEGWRCLMPYSPEQTLLEAVMCNISRDYTIRHFYGEEPLSTYHDKTYPIKAKRDFLHFMDYSSDMFTKEIPYHDKAVFDSYMESSPL